MANCLTRISPHGSIICVNTRWHKEDLIGYLTSEDYIEAVLDGGGNNTDLFKVVNLPALCEDPTTDPLGRKEGESVFPEYKSASWFKRIRAQIDAYEWRTQYQGDPQVRTESDIDLKKIRYISLSDVPEGIERLRGWDFAISETQQADFTAGALIAYDASTDTVYLLDIFRNKLSWPKNFKIITELSRRDVEIHGMARMGVEAVAGFGAVFQQLKDALLGEIEVRAQNPPHGGKLLRAQPWLNKIEAGRFCIVRGNWNKDFIAELQVFPAGAHDDQIDAISVGWERLVGRNRNGADPDSKRNTSSSRPSSGSRPSGGPRP
jgi:predicted phage terminase large subunit-like protein